MGDPPVNAALEAVRQWEYTPTVVGGRPMPVIITVTVNFTMQSPPSSAAPNVPRSAPAVDLADASRNASRLMGEGRALSPQQAIHPSRLAPLARGSHLQDDRR